MGRLAWNPYVESLQTHEPTEQTPLASNRVERKTSEGKRKLQVDSSDFLGRRWHAHNAQQTKRLSQELDSFFVHTSAFKRSPSHNWGLCIYQKPACSPCVCSQMPSPLRCLEVLRQLEVSTDIGKSTLVASYPVRPGRIP